MEQELKFQLPDRAGYERLAAALGPELGRKLQVNHYLDTPAGAIARSGKSMLRVRDEDGQPILTFKLGARQQDGYFEAEELELELTAAQGEALQRGEVADWSLPPLRRLCEAFGQPERLVPQGSMRNLRRLFALPHDEVAELDETTFPDGHVDYELEVETAHPEGVRQHLETLGLPLVPQTLTKFARFLQHR